MCLAVPMQISAIDQLSARCEARGTERDVSLFLLQDDLPVIGDFVMVSMGRALRKVSPEDAHLTWELLDQILDHSSGQAGLV
jgi:hydrogenase expression/formation protein HypC